MNKGTDSKHIIIGGGSGFIGRALTMALRARGDVVTWVSRDAGDDRLTWQDIAQHGLPACDVVINLAGKHILDMSRRWTKSYRAEVISSRIETTNILVDAINASSTTPTVFISTAGKCFYGSQAFRASEQYFDLDEHSAPVGVDFPAELVSMWEAAADRIDTAKVRHAKLRFGIVLSSRDNEYSKRRSKIGARGIFPMLQAIFQRGLCLSMGAGVQPFPWVHIDDVVGICLQAIDNPDMRGIYNAVSPGIVSNNDFTKLLARKLNKSVLGHVPGWLIKAVVGAERSTILLLGQRVKPTRTQESGYVFRFPKLEACLDDLLALNQKRSQI
ncbi:MAG: TIGR01777 family protein [Pseudomonadales bacterium]|nr:TIGR01777 family protein [Pseudomonadales bacterium]